MRLAILMLTLPVIGCAPAVMPTSERALCDALAALVDRHSDALLQDGGDASVMTGADLIAAYGAGCGP